MSHPTRSEVALVTGGGRGIGRGIALALADSGADVALAYHEMESAAQAVAEQIRRRGRRSMVIQCDLSRPADTERLVEATVAEFGRLEIVVSNAGSLTNASFLDTTPSQYDAQLDVNARAAFFLVQAAARRMIAQGEGGRIVLVTSEAADKPVPGLAAYCVSKAAEKMVMKMAAVELAKHGIRVNAVAPGTIETDLNREMLADTRMRATLLSDVLLGRPGSPDDIGGAVAYLVSDRAKHITGATLAVTGGSLMT